MIRDDALYFLAVGSNLERSSTLCGFLSTWVLESTDYAVIIWNVSHSEFALWCPLMKLRLNISGRAESQLVCTDCIAQEAQQVPCLIISGEQRDHLAKGRLPDGSILKVYFPL